MTFNYPKKNSVNGSYNPNNDTMNINPTTLLRWSLNNMYFPKDYSRSGWNMGLGFPQSTIIHEFGHHIHHKVFNLSDGIVKGNSAVSSYGNANHMEAFAEAFTAYCYGVNPLQGKEYYSNFKQVMKDNGLSGFEGIFKSSNVKPTKVTTPTTSGATTNRISTKPTTKPTNSAPPVSKGSSLPKPTTTNKPSVPKPATSTTKSTTTKSTTKNPTKERTASNFVKTTNSISGTIRGKSFTATITDGIRNRGYIERTVGNTRYRIDISTGAFTKV